jgi:hypothetical protein
MHESGVVYKYSEISQFEIAALINLHVLSVEEAFSLVPSLKNLGERMARHRGLGENEVDPAALIEDLLDDLRRYS